MLTPIVHSAVAFVYSALALAETFVLFAVVIGLLTLVVRGILRAFANTEQLLIAAAFLKALYILRLRMPHQSGPYTPIIGPSGRKLLFRPSTGE
jgi:hypothetical protein